MAKRLLVRGARQLITLRGPAGPRRGTAMADLSIIDNGAFIVEDGLIAEIGPARRIEALSRARTAEEIDAKGCVVLPGFIDSHTHLVFGAPRLTEYEMRLEGATYEQLAEAGGGILASLRNVRGAPPRKLRDLASRFARIAASLGTTTMEVKSGYGLDAASEIKMLRVVKAIHHAPLDILPTFLGAHATPPEFRGRPDDYIAWLSEQLLPLIARLKLARFADAYCDANAFSTAQTRAYLDAARRHGLAIKLHAGQFSNIGAVALALEFDAISADHLEAIGDEDIRLLGNSRTIATLLPGSVFHLGLSRYAPARKLIGAGAAVALASDFNPGSSPTCSMPMVMSLACAQMRMTPAEAICAATINGGHALGIASRTGSLEVGKQADFAITTVSDYRELPYYFGVPLIAATYQRGQRIAPERPHT